MSETKLKPFNLEKVLAGEPVVTRDGRTVSQLVNFDAPNETYTLRGVVDGQVHAWLSSGHYHTSLSDYSNDLFMTPKKRTMWIQLWSLGSMDVVFSATGDTKEDAARMIHASRRVGEPFQHEYEE